MLAGYYDFNYDLIHVSARRKPCLDPFYTHENHLQSHLNAADRTRQREQERTKMVPGSSKLLFLLEPLGLIEPL